MSAELPALSAVVARLAKPEINLAAFGGITYPLALIVESPIIMLLAASTALSKDRASFSKLRRYMTAASLVLTVVHLLLAFTPLYDFIAKSLLSAPAEIIEPGRIGLVIFIPWSWAIAYRRFHQGMLIRFNRSYTVGAGTFVRLATNFTFLATGLIIKTIPGIVVASSAVIAGVLAEAVYVSWAARAVVNTELRQAPVVFPPLVFSSFMSFYIPLVLTSLLVLLVQPVGSAAINRMPMALASLAVWPVASGLVSLFRSMGTAFNEVVVALLDEPQARQSLWRFTWQLCLLTTVALLLVAATPLSAFWFGTVSGLSPDLSRLASFSVWLALPLPALTVLQSWFQGTLVHHKHTRSITESVVLFLGVASLALAAGARWSPVAGLYLATGAFTLANLAQTAWLWLRARRFTG